MKIRTTQKLALYAGAVAVAGIMTAGTASAALIGLTEEAAGSTPGGFSTSFGTGTNATTSDGFAYDVNDPASALPANTHNATNTYHANSLIAPANVEGADAILNYSLTAFTTTALDPTIVVDLYGRNANENRDDDIDVILLNGGVVVATVNMGIGDGTHHGRATFSGLAIGTTFDGIRLVAGDNVSGGGEAGNNFALAEIRAASIVPEPGSLALLGLGGLAMLRRRRA